MENQNRVVIKTNLLNGISSTLTIMESRLLSLILSEARESGKGDSPENPLKITAKMYADTFNIELKHAYRDLLKNEDTLFNKVVYGEDNKDGLKIKTRWITHIKYLPKKGTLEVVLSHFVLNNILRIDGAETPYTSYQLSNFALLKSTASMRLYEIVAQYRKMQKVPCQDLDSFKRLMNIEPDTHHWETKAFNNRVVKKAVLELKEKLGIELEVNMKFVRNGTNTVEIKILNLGVDAIPSASPVTPCEAVKLKGCNDTPKQKTSDIEQNKALEEAKKIGAYVAPKFPSTKPKAQKPITDKQLHKYIFQLITLPEIKDMAEVGESDMAFIHRLGLMLKDQKGLEVLMPYLKQLGFKPSYQ